MSRKGDSITSAISCHSHSTRTASAVSLAQPARYRQFEIDSDENEDAPDSDHDATLSDAAPSRNPRGPQPDTEPEDTGPEDQAELTDYEEEREVPLSAWVHLMTNHCQVKCVGPTTNSKQDNIIYEEEEHDDTDVNTSEVDSEGQFLDGSDDDHQDDLDRINELIAEIEEAKLKKLKAEKARLEAKKAASQSPRKKKRTPTRKKTRATSQRKVPIARKRTLKGTAPKQVTIEEGNNTLKSPPQPPTTARILKPELAAAETQNNQPILQSVLEAIHPYFVKLQDSADKMSNAARRMEQEREEARLRMSAINMGQEQPHPSGPTLVDGTRPISANPIHHPASTAPAISPEEPLRPAFHQATIKSYQADSSKGNEEEIHGVSITSLDIDRAMMPEGLKNAEIKGLWDRASDMAALPGKCSPGGGDSESGGAGEEVMNQLLETFGSDSTKIALLDTGYCRKGRHGLGLITSSNKLHEACQKILKKEEDTFKNQRFQFLHYLVRLGYSTEFVEDYVERGLMPRIIKETYVNFLALLNKIRHKDMGSDEAWEDSEAYVILQVHSENLLDIRTNSNSKKMLLLQNYIYLRDARKKDFGSNTITEKNIGRVDKMNQKLQRELESLRAAKGRGGREPTKDKGREGDSTLKKCSQCKSRTLHTALKLEHNKTVCPLAGHAGSWAKVAAEEVATAVLANKERPVGDIIKEVSDNWPKKS
ncbi:unnamed protein product [Cylindrotheca closterium]|uniref:Uncharacterized protein n=1 Tax=Cylindrotheca closterium TaxID=2856 RepID=A0AAD2CGF7_9STRA|nr:unnamed protein product [Cylindrotheca closterium]